MEGQVKEALEVLGIPADSDRQRVTDAYRRLARLTHPDVSSAPDAAERFAMVTAAYRLLTAAFVDARNPGQEPASESVVSPRFGARVQGRPPIVAGPVILRPAQGNDGADRARRGN
jgi:hypothetical protein